MTGQSRAWASYVQTGMSLSGIAARYHSAVEPPHLCGADTGPFHLRQLRPAPVAHLVPLPFGDAMAGRASAGEAVLAWYRAMRWIEAEVARSWLGNRLARGMAMCSRGILVATGFRDGVRLEPVP